ncbi:hypothetical protein D3C76_1432770 [compost metagenome]
MIQHGVVGQNRKLNQHLIDFRITVPPHGDNLLLVKVQHLRYFSGIITLWQWISWTMIQEIAKYDHLIGLLLGCFI